MMLARRKFPELVVLDDEAPARPHPRRLFLLNIPIGPDTFMQVYVPDDMSEVEWGHMMRVLEAMRPGVVRQ